ncbi:MAG: hypothetical protein PWP08_1483 [Methanofollis sp.]|nr:hypothetical protein [Methanofollis sp.]
MVKSPQAIALLVCFISTVILLGYPLIIDIAGPRDAAFREATAVAVGGTDTPAIRITGTCADVGNATVYLVDPVGVYHLVGKGILESSGSRDWYIFHYHRPEAGTPEYWITDDPDMVFTRKYVESVEPFEPQGIWVVEIVPAGYGADTVELRVAL